MSTDGSQVGVALFPFFKQFLSFLDSSIFTLYYLRYVKKNLKVGQLVLLSTVIQFMFRQILIQTKVNVVEQSVAYLHPYFL